MKKNNIIIDIQNLYHSFGEKEIYKNLNLQIREACIFALLGKNGVGKSTLINILMGYIKPKSGKCFVFSKDSYDLEPNLKEDIALLYEGFTTYDYMSIKQIENYFAPFYKKWDKTVFYDLVNLMDLNHNQKISSLSFGQKSQVVLGLIFAQNAKLLILDDYSMGLDAGYRRLFIDYLKDYVKNTNKTVLITSHIMSDLVELIDDIAILQKGGDIYQSSMEEFLENFKCYKINNNNEKNQFSNIHRIKEYKDFKKIFTFEKNNSFEELDIDFEDKFLGYVGKY